MRHFLKSPFVLALGTTAAFTVGAKEFILEELLRGPALWASLGGLMLATYPVAVVLKRLMHSDPLSLPRTPSPLPQGRQDEIRSASDEMRPRMLQAQEEFTNRHMRAEEELSMEMQLQLRRSPSWVTVLSTTSLKGKRLVVGLRNRGCRYRKLHPPGCLVCGFNDKILYTASPNRHELGRQLSKALKARKGCDTLEFLGDGSFLSDTEIRDPVKGELFDRINRAKEITRVLVEARPKDVDENDLRLLVNRLSREQRIEIGVGLETASDFVREHCLHKGFELKEFVECVDLIASRREYSSRIGVVAYLFLKPPFLTDTEAIDDVVSSLEYVKALSKTKGVDIIPKIEPAVVAEGTVLEILNDEGEYEPLSFWSVVEVILHAHRLGLGKILRVGGRYDMFGAERLPGLYSLEDSRMLHQFDFIVYGATMAFNQHHDIVNLLADVSEAMGELTFQTWERDLFGSSGPRSLCTQYSSNYRRKIRSRQDTPRYIAHHERQKRIFRALDKIEYQNPEINRLLSPTRDVTGDCMAKLNLDAIQEAFIDIFETREIFCSVTIVDCYMQSNGVCRIRFDLEDLADLDLVEDVWVAIPISEAVDESNQVAQLPA